MSFSWSGTEVEEGKDFWTFFQILSLVSSMVVGQISSYPYVYYNINTYTNGHRKYLILVYLYITIYTYAGFKGTMKFFI